MEVSRRQSQRWTVALAFLLAAATVPHAGAVRDGELQDDLEAPAAAAGPPLGARFRVLRRLGRARPGDRPAGIRAGSHALLEASSLGRRLPDGLPNSKFKEEARLGGGGYAEAFLVEVLEPTFGLQRGERAVLKILKMWMEVYISPKNIGDTGAGEALAEMQKECDEAKAIQGMAAASHDLRPHASRFMACFGTNAATATGDEPYFSLVEPCGDTTLFDLVDGTPLGGDQVTQLVKQMIEGLYLLSRMDPPRMHHDIKPENIVLKSTGGTSFLHLIDYGFMVQASQSVVDGPCSAKGTPGYVPLQAAWNWTTYGTTTAWDAYALGAIILEMTTGMRPAILRSEVAFLIEWKLTGETNLIESWVHNFTAEFEEEFKSTFPETDDFKGSRDFEKDARVEDSVIGAFYPIYPRPGSTSTAVFTPQWWLKFLAAMNDEAGPTYPKFQEYWRKHGALLGDLFDTDPLRRPTPEQLLNSAMLRGVKIPADPESWAVKNIV